MTEDEMTGYPRLLAAAKMRDRVSWSMGDALAAEIGPRAAHVSRKMEHAKAWLEMQGYEISLSTLTWQRRTALAFPPSTRIYNAPIHVYSEATKHATNSAEAMARVKEYVEDCSGAGVKPTAQGFRRMMGRTTYRYSAAQFTKYVMESDEATQDAVLDELHRRKAERRPTGGSGKPRVTTNPSDQASACTKTIGHHVTRLAGVIASDLEKIRPSHRGYLRRKLMLDQARISLILAVLDGKIECDETLRTELEKLHDERKQTR